MKLNVIVLLFIIMGTSYSVNWAVIVAGSKGFYNYRHQADVCHAYQIMIQQGIRAGNIIVMSYNDVAKSRENPFPNTLFNKPTGLSPSIDVNQGCIIDYQGSSVTPSNFLAILEGDATKIKGGSGKVLKSNEQDIVFVNFVDHGAPELIAFPSLYLYANNLMATFEVMVKKKMFKELTFYLEACESGSMFINLPNDLNIYALSAASPYESSSATYCPPTDQINGKHIGVCLADLFSINWMEDTEASDLTTKTLQEQFEIVQTKTTESQVMQWGDLSFTKQTIGKFMGNYQMSKGFLSKIQRVLEYDNGSVLIKNENSRDTKINYLLQKVGTNSIEIDFYNELQEELNKSKMFAKTFKQFQDDYELSGIHQGTTNFECYQNLIERLEGQCGKVNEQSLGLFKYIHQYCSMQKNWKKAEFKHC